MSLGSFEFGNPQASQLSRIVDNEISGLRSRITALEAQLSRVKVGHEAFNLNVGEVTGSTAGFVSCSLSVRV
jgi:hypothetical protein